MSAASARTPSVTPAPRTSNGAAFSPGPAPRVLGAASRGSARSSGTVPHRPAGRRRQGGSGAMDATSQPSGHDQTPAHTPTTRERRRPRVMVLFGGRSGEHAISFATAGGVMRAIDRDAVRRARRRHHARRAAGCSPPTTRALGDHRRPGCRRSRTTAAHVVLPCRRSTTATSGARGRAGAARPRRASTWCSPCCTARSARTAPSRACSSSPTCGTSGAGVLASAVGMDKHFMKLVLAGHGLPVGPYAVMRPGELDRDPDGVAARTSRRSGCRCSSSRPAPARQPGHLPGDDLADLPAAIAAAARARPQGHRRGRRSSGREIECGVLGGRDGDRRARRCPARSSSPTPGTTFYDFEAKYLDEAGVELACPADLPDDVVEEVRDDRRADVRGGRAARAWPASTCS